MQRLTSQNHKLRQDCTGTVLEGCQRGRSWLHICFFWGVLFSEVLSRVPNIFQDTHIEISSGANLEQKHGSKSSCFRSVIQLARSFKIQTRGSRSRHGAEKSGHYTASRFGNFKAFVNFKTRWVVERSMKQHAQIIVYMYATFTTSI